MSSNAPKSGTTKHAESFGILGCCKRRFKLGQLTPPPEVHTLFSKYSEHGFISAEKLKAFLDDVQKEKEVTLADVEKIMTRLLQQERHLLSKPKHELNEDQFFHYLLDPELNLAINNKVHHDMTLPASNYFIYTGHNSYLTGNQLNSDCSDEPIIDALKRGVRVIELDLWPSGDKRRIKVYHGRTLTAPVDFEKCLIAIRDHAFLSSPYPVVITFEDHLTPELQAQVAEITTRVLGKLLKIPHANEKFHEFPSPEDIRGQILISTKPPKEYLKGDKHEKAAEKKKTSNVEIISRELPQIVSSDWGPEVPGFIPSESLAKFDPSNKPVSEEITDKKSPPSSEPVSEGIADRNFDPSNEVVSDEDTDKDDDDDDDESVELDHVANPEYKSIISIRAGKLKGASTIDSLVVNEFVKRVSLSEPQLEKLAEKNSALLIKFTEKNILRIYPYGLRFNSSNYNPLVAWSHGAQMVAFNMQGYGRPLWLVHGWFRANGGCGYVKKPDFLSPSKTGTVFDPRAGVPTKITLKVKVIMGLGWLEKFGKHHFDRYSPPDFYVKIGIAGFPKDTQSKKTETIEDEWLPKWKKEFEFPISVPEFALLRIEVHEYDMTDKDDFGGQTCLPISELKSGYRCVPLYDKKGILLEGVRLFCHFELVEHK